MKNNFHAAAISYKKAVKGEVTLERAVGYLEGMKYHVRFYSSPNDETLVRYNLSDIADKTTAFTYNGLAHVVFISNDLSYSEKLHRLLHETGHIVLNHIGTNTLHLKNNDETEAEAEAFVYTVLYEKRKSTSHTSICILLLLCLLIGGSAQQHYAHSKTEPQQYREESEAEPETVYITKSGSKYHRADCIYTKDKETIAVRRADAERNYTPCIICRP